MTTPGDSDDASESASARGARITRALVEAADRFGFTAVTEYALPGARIDVVWQWRPPSPIPGIETVLPIVGFEIESSWRVRKHIKGDLVNLQDLRPLVGVIVLCGDGPDVESTRRFASRLVNRPGTRIVVWSDEDVEALVAGDSGDLDLVPTNPAGTEPAGTSLRELTGKYRPLWEWLRRQTSSPVSARFVDIEHTLGFALPPSSRRHLPHWYGYDGTAVGRAIRDAGWRARHVDLEAETVIFERVSAQDEDAEPESV